MARSQIYYNLSNEDYHNEKSSFSRSSIMDFKKSPKNYWAKHIKEDRPAKESTPAMEFGTAFHTLILESHLFDIQYICLPEKVLKKDNQKQYEINKILEEEAEKNKVKVLSHADYTRLRDMQAALRGNEKARELITDGVYESSYFWEDEASGLMLKARPDILKRNFYVDLKTIDDASPANFQRAMVTGGYHIQAAMIRDAVRYHHGSELSAFINICVEKNYPYSIGIYIIDEEAINVGENEYKSLLLRMKSCIVNNDFPDLEILNIGLPTWAK
jgi:exodeoxyribonuclease VIII